MPFILADTMNVTSSAQAVTTAIFLGGFFILIFTINAQLRPKAKKEVAD